MHRGSVFLNYACISFLTKRIMAIQKERLVKASLLSILAFLLLTIDEKLGISRHTKGIIVSWSDVSEEIPAFLIFSCLIGLAFYFFFPKLFTSLSGCMMCAKCEKSFIKPFKLNDEQKPICDICGSNLEKLDGFYDRHPGLKDDNKTEGQT